MKDRTKVVKDVYNENNKKMDSAAFCKKSALKRKNKILLSKVKQTSILYNNKNLAF
jgi:hypothetical protein